MSAEIIAGWDFKAKKRFKPEQTPVQNQINIIAQGLSLDLSMPPEVLTIIYETGLGFVAPEKDGA